MEKLGKYCKIISGYAFKSNDLSEGTEVPVIKIGNISNGNDVITDSSTQYVSRDFLSIDEKYHIKKGDVLISLTGSHINQPNSMVGRSCRNFSDTEFLLNQRAGKVIPNENADKNYLYYLLNTESFKYSICNRAYGAANQANVSPSDIENIKWNFPPLLTQQKIASILSAYDKLIQNYKKQIEALQTAASELYKEWFVRFRFPGYQTAEFENGIPKGWKIVHFNEIAELINGRAYLMPELQETGKYRIVRVGNFSGKDEWFYSDMELEDNKYCESGDLLYKWACNFGPEIWNEEKVIYHYHIWKVIPNKNNMKKIFLYHLLNFSTPQWLGGTNGTAMVHITKESMEKKRIVLPSFELINEFDIIAENLNKRCRNLEQQISNLTQQRDLLLPRLMSGKLEVE